MRDLRQMHEMPHTPAAGRVQRCLIVCIDELLIEELTHLLARREKEQRILIAAWQNVGFQMMLILAGLQAIPKEHYEAASLDGARGLKAFWYITLPGIRNVLVLATLITVIGGFKVFDLVFVTTGGGPANATQVLGTYTYTQAFSFGNMGYANAMAVVLLVTAALLGWLQVRLSRRG